jgi:hypothetical protein
VKKESLKGTYHSCYPQFNIIGSILYRHFTIQNNKQQQLYQEKNLDKCGFFSVIIDLTSGGCLSFDKSN